MNKRKIRIIVSIIIAALVLVCLLPVPKHIEKDYYAVDTFGGEKAVISVDITYLNFLFLEDKMLGTVQVFDDGEIYTYEDASLMYYGKYPTNTQDEFVHALGGFYFNPTTYMNNEGEQVIGPEITHTCLSRDFDKILLYHQEEDKLKEGQTRKDVSLKAAEIRQYVGNVEKDKISDSIKHFERFARETPIEDPAQ